MIKRISTVFILLIISAALQAESPVIQGQWLLTTAKIGNNTEEVYQQLLFREDGYAEMEGRVFGSWEEGKEGKDITIESRMIEEFNGNWNVTSPGDGMITLKSGERTLTLKKYDVNGIMKENRDSLLRGVWKLNIKDDDGADIYLNFTLPDVLTAVYIGYGFSGREGGRWQWTADKNTSSLILMIHNSMLRGKWAAAVKEDGILSIARQDETITAGRIEQDGKNREKLDFSDTEITEEESSPWNDPMEFIESMSNIKKVSYRKSSLVNELDIFLTEDISAGVSVNESYGTVDMDRIFDGISAYSFSEYNPFYPVEEPDSYTVAGEKEINVPAGKFKCTVININDDFNERKIRLYMITDRPGIYAKVIILGKNFDEEEYTVYELTGIEEISG